MAQLDEPLARNRDFKVVLVSQGISALGDAVSFTALPLLVLALTGSGVAMGLVGALQGLPDFVFGMVAGALADRSDRKRMMFLADFGRAILTALIPLSVFLGGPTMAVILLVAVPMGVLRSLFMAGYTSSTPALVGRANLSRANAIFETVFSTSFIVGPAIAGFLAATIGPGPTLAIDAVTFALSALGLFLVRRPLRAPADRPPTHIVDDIREGIAFIAHHPVLRASVLLWGAVATVLAPIVPALAVYLTRDLGQTPAALGIVLSAFGIGTVAGSLLAARAGSRMPVAPALLVGPAVMGATLLAIAAIPSIPVIALASIAAGVAQSVVLVTYITLRAASTPDALLGRVGSTARVISLGLQPIGLLIGGLLIDRIGGMATMAAMGVALIVVPSLFVPVAAIRHATLTPRPR